MPFLDPGPAVAAGGDQVSDSTDGAPAKELVEKPRQASMLACTTSGEARAPAKAGVDARARHVRRAGGEGGESTRVPHVRLGHKTTLHVSKIGLTRVTRLGARHSGTSMETGRKSALNRFAKTQLGRCAAVKVRKMGYSFRRV